MQAEAPELDAVRRMEDGTVAFGKARLSKVEEQKHKEKVRASGQEVREKVPITDWEAQEELEKQSAAAKIMNRALRNANHEKQLPHFRADTEYKLRKIATRGILRLFNAIEVAQRDIAAETEPQKKVSSRKSAASDILSAVSTLPTSVTSQKSAKEKEQEKKEQTAAAKSKFLDILQHGTGSDFYKKKQSDTFASVAAHNKKKNLTKKPEKRKREENSDNSEDMDDFAAPGE
eukprot:TRINITY_DN84514_c0_g1_i1.p1 TRINITY_DN84514_c0_g1~~TRINITY_DN84514_c0_g1_i1.p1  ORF type:complete len:264 (-),score=57.93 TRINITY_DN84514_c0_g1_i1:81-776(-)